MAATDKTRIAKPSSIVEDDQGQLRARTRSSSLELKQQAGEPSAGAGVKFLLRAIDLIDERQLSGGRWFHS